ncbi:MAG: hypothetical protein IPQ07_45305 [Myxococcales bacterium]|nr:hypothetical protein [Myxococcales bacterium]
MPRTLDDVSLAILAEAADDPSVAATARAALQLRVAARALEAAPHDLAIWRAVLSAALGAGQLPLAVQGLQLVSARDPDLARDLWLCALDVVISEGAEALAPAIAAAATRALPSDAVLWATTALVTHDRDLTAARTAAETAYLLDPASPLVWIALARLYAHDEQPLRAEAAAQTAVDLGVAPAYVDAIIFAHLAH